MTEYFRTVAVAGEDLTDPASGEVVTPQKLADRVRERLTTSTTVTPIDLSRRRAEQIVAHEGQVVIPSQDIGDLKLWAPAGSETLTVVDHEINETASTADYGRIGTLLELAGIYSQNPLASSRTIFHALEKTHGGWEQLAVSDTDVWFTNTDLLRHVRRLAITRIGGRHARILTTTSRPLLGLNSTLAVDPDGLPTTGVPSDVISYLTQFYAKYTMISEAENLTNSRVDNYARLRASGAGRGLAALIYGLRGSVTPLVDHVLALPSQRRTIAASDLIIMTIDTLHPQTVHDSHIGPLGELAAAQATPLIVFTTETSLSRHEQAEWGIHAVYQVPAHDICSYIGRVLSSTWLRADVR